MCACAQKRPKRRIGGKRSLTHSLAPLAPQRSVLPRSMLLRCAPLCSTPLHPAPLLVLEWESGDVLTMYTRLDLTQIQPIMLFYEAIPSHAGNFLLRGGKGMCPSVWLSVTLSRKKSQKWDESAKIELWNNEGKIIWIFWHLLVQTRML